MPIDCTINEQARLNALRDLGLLDTPPSESFDRLTRMASRLLNAPVSTISLTDADRQWFKSRVGMDLTQLPREKAPCTYAIRADEVFEIPDLLADPRFADSPLAQAGIRFYAGAPLFTRAGHGLGTLAVVDEVPRRLDPEQTRILQDLAGMVMCQIELQNMIGRTDAGSGLPNQYQLFEDIDGLATHSPNLRAELLVVDVLSPDLSEHALRTLGAPYIDAVTQAAMLELRREFRSGGTIYHVGPHRCALLEHGVAIDSNPPNRALRALSGEIVVDGIPVRPQPAVGSYGFLLGQVSARDVLRRATNAVEDARASDSASSRYDCANERMAARRFTLVSDFSPALRAPEQLSLVFQPRVNLSSGRWVGAEALLRWKHPRLGEVSPAEFVPLIERTSLMQGLTEWVGRRAMEQTAQWHAAGLALRTSINASALNLAEEDFAERFIAMLRAAHVEPALVELEFTESTMAQDIRRVAEQLGELRQLGVGIAIDDFGTGFSNLAYLQQLPVTALKIDRSFVRGMDASDKNRRLVRTMIDMARDLEYDVVAEGIETPAAYQMLAEWGCDEGQGFYMAMPMPADALGRAMLQAG